MISFQQNGSILVMINYIVNVNDNSILKAKSIYVINLYYRKEENNVSHWMLEKFHWLKFKEESYD